MVLSLHLPVHVINASHYSTSSSWIEILVTLLTSQSGRSMHDLRLSNSQAAVTVAVFKKQKPGNQSQLTWAYQQPVALFNQIYCLTNSINKKEPLVFADARDCRRSQRQRHRHNLGLTEWWTDSSSNSIRLFTATDNHIEFVCMYLPFSLCSYYFPKVVPLRTCNLNG